MAEEKGEVVVRENKRNVWKEDKKKKKDSEGIRRN